ncbi:MAG: hypothetical protein JJU13_06060 [Balneolaceae bacterium]|nr:hypothetical protein [Balneolaceae bacterium]
MPRKKLNENQKQVAYCLIARLRDQNYFTDTKELIFDEISHATRLYIKASDLEGEYLNLARKEFDQFKLEDAKSGKIDGVINAFSAGALEESLKFSNFIDELIYPRAKDGHIMTFIGNRSNNNEIKNYLTDTIHLLRYTEKFFKKFKYPYIQGMEWKLLPVGKINQDLLSRTDTFFKKIGKKIQFNNDLRDWIINRVKITSPYRYKAVHPDIKSIATNLKKKVGQDKISNWSDSILINYIVNEYELSGHPEYILSTKKFRDRIRQNIHKFR